MTLLHPDLAARLTRWREALASGALTAAGIWIMSLGGWVYHPTGAFVAGVGVCWAIVALRRLRFARAVSRPGSAPGVISLDEGQVSYFGPVYGGALAIAEIVELRIARRDGLVEWRLRGRDGSLVRIPATALGAERLFDVFWALPGIDILTLTRALDAPPRDGLTPPLWRRPGVDRPAPLVSPGEGLVRLADRRDGGRGGHHDLS
jgi:hypothetical protein